MYSIEVALWCPTEQPIEGDVPGADLGFTVRDAVSSELAAYFRPYTVIGSSARRTAVHGQVGYVFQLRFESGDESSDLLPAPIDDVAGALERDMAQLLERVLGVAVTAGVTIHCELPPDEWEVALREIA